MVGSSKFSRLPLHYLYVYSKMNRLQKKVKVEKWQKRLMCTIFWDHEDVIYTEYLRIDRKVAQRLKRGTLRPCTTFVRQLNANVQGFSYPESLFFMTMPGHTLPESLSLSSLSVVRLFSHIHRVVPIWPHTITTRSLC